MKGFCKPTVTTVGLAKQVACFKEWVFALHELGGRDSFRRNWLLYAKRIKQLDFIVFCIDSQDVRSFEDVHTYLKEVASHFKEKPIVVIFNNHRVLPRPITVEHLEECVKMKSVRNVNQHRAIFTCLCDVSVVHPVNSTLPEPLSQAFSQLSEALKENTPKEKLPHTPKPALQIPPGPSPPTPPLRRKNGGHSPGLADSPSGSFSRRLKEENSVARVLADNLESPSPDRNPDTKEAKAAPKVLSPSAEHSLLQRSFTQQHHESHSPFTTNLPTEPSPINEQSTTILYESPRAKDKLPNFPPKGTENDLTLEQPTSTDLSLSGSSIQKTVVESVVCIPTPKR
ncbi:ADP-ribosylation factor family, putative [Angomonas deanei]|uniref:ADP-ribosylation factor family, putative n=1 Tax=Angomonas deanei TaxID=59799 RepID=A0A7G2C0Y4_9TRYP|nr:ADP-ribosylation factor family, putative [Angomonas deanei]